MGSYLFPSITMIKVSYTQYVSKLSFDSLSQELIVVDTQVANIYALMENKREEYIKYSE